MNISDLSMDYLESVVGGGIVDTVSADAEAATRTFLKNFAESSEKFSVFINTPPAQLPAGPNFG